MANIHITHIDTACVLLEINGFRILTDPDLDDAVGGITTDQVPSALGQIS